MSFLQTILEYKKEEVAARKKSVLRSTLEDMPQYSLQRLGFAHAVQGKDMAVIAEIKKASPSKSVLRADFDPLEIARQYHRAEASALSVLTDEKFFMGQLEFMAKIRNFVPLPILRKDFIIDQYQLYEARAFGADAVLLIVAALEPSRLRELHAEAQELGLDVLVEVHSEDEVDTLDLASVSLVGINNRDLMTFETDIMTSVRVKKYLPSHITVVSESGISSPRDLDLLMGHGIHAVLIGEHFMRADDPGKALHELLAGVANGVR